MKKPNEKIGGGDYFDGSIYYQGAAPPPTPPPDENGGLIYTHGQPAQGPMISRSEYARIVAEQAKKKETYDALVKEYGGKPIAASDVAKIREKYGDGAVQAVAPPQDTDAPIWRRNGGKVLYQVAPQESFVGYAPTAQKTTMVAQMAIPEYELEGRANIRPQQIDARREGYSDRLQNKISQLGSKTNHSITDMNQAKREHLALVNATNAQIGAPGTGGRGWGAGTVNNSIAYAMEKADDGKASAKNHAANAEAHAKSVQAGAKAQGDILQKKFDSAGGQANQASHMQDLIEHLAQREIVNAQTQQKVAATQQQDDGGLLATLNPSPFEGNDIASMLKT